MPAGKVGGRAWPVTFQSRLIIKVPVTSPPPPVPSLLLLTDVLLLLLCLFQLHLFPLLVLLSTALCLSSLLSLPL